MVVKESKDLDYLKGKIEPFIFNSLNKKTYDVVEVNPKILLTWNRLDIAFRIFYLKFKNKNLKLATSIYLEIIRAQTIGKYKEYGNEKKVSKADFIESFNKTFNDIKINGFDKKKTLIPLSKNRSILNGAHRIASAIYLRKNVSCLELDFPDMIADYKYLHKMNVTDSIIEIGVSTFIEETENIYIAFLWPSGRLHTKTSELEFSNIVYKKEIRLTKVGAFNLLYELYSHMDWIGDKSNYYHGIQKKVKECFTDFEPFTIIIFQSDSLNNVRKTKENVRKINDIGYSSIHITDTKDESIKISRLLLNPNGLHFLNYSNLFKVNNLKIRLIKQFLKVNKINPLDIVFDSSIILSLYGLREANDIDYLLKSGINIDFVFENFESHDDVLNFYDQKKSSLIYDSKNFFYYEGIKFISFNQLYIMKKNRGEEKDLIDLKIMEGLIENNQYKIKFNQLKQKSSYLIFKVNYSFRNFLVNVLKKLKFYNLFRIFYQKLTKN